jgi:hypothetical protein
VVIRDGRGSGYHLSPAIIVLSWQEQKVLVCQSVPEYGCELVACSRVGTWEDQDTSEQAVARRA